jgi:hypothetical protein
MICVAGSLLPQLFTPQNNHVMQTRTCPALWLLSQIRGRRRPAENGREDCHTRWERAGVAFRRSSNHGPGCYAVSRHDAHRDRFGRLRKHQFS